MKPEVDFQDGPPPTTLVIEDLIAGSGEAASDDSEVLVHYVGVDFESGEEFDSSWNRNEPIAFPLKGLIKGWQEGIPGMQVGGRRKLICPPEYAYGRQGHRLAGRTLIFVIDLLEVIHER
jgi:peptidylprolyl isomerase